MFGEEGLFESLVEENAKLFARQEFEKIVVLDPHAYWALEHYYPRFGVNYPIQHYAVFLAERLDALRRLPIKPLAGTVTYHDNCWG